MLQLERVEKAFAGQPVLLSISFRVARGETVALLGPSGSGKSTLLRLIAGLLKPDGGRILWQGKDLARVPVHQRRFGLVFQDYALFPHLSVLENVRYPLRWQGISRREGEAQARALLQQVNMGDKADRQVTELSGGEQQRVALARTLAARPRLLMFDEPLGALDYNLRGQLLDFLQGVLYVQEQPALYVTHDYEEAFALAQRVILLHQGRIVQDARPETLVEHPATPWVARFLGLGLVVAGERVAADVVQTPVGRFVLPAATRIPCRRPFLLLRREGATLEGEGMNVVHGRVQQCRYVPGRGYFVRLDNGAEAIVSQRLPLGGACRLSYPQVYVFSSCDRQDEDLGR